MSYQILDVKPRKQNGIELFPNVRISTGAGDQHAQPASACHGPFSHAASLSDRDDSSWSALRSDFGKPWTVEGWLTRGYRAKPRLMGRGPVKLARPGPVWCVPARGTDTEGYVRWI